ncbi:MAG: ATP-dependent DNA helicase [Candidatus Obscuribacterales bacterium]|nr:ATP-dependent DNA helicase [Candidatus Obscuribacterales bacterium]
MSSVSISIRDFALPSPLTGSIEANSGYAQIFGGAEKIAAEGRDWHSRLQKQRQKEFGTYKIEHRLAHKFEGKRFTFNVSGRADGFVDGTIPLIEEIKSAVNPLDLVARLGDANHPYRLQLATYAYIVHLERQVIPSTRFLVVGTAGENLQEVLVNFNLIDYEAWLARRLAELEQEVENELANRSRRETLSVGMSFPFPNPRPGQRELIEDLGHDLEHSHQCLVQAPTGLGKTAAIIFPTLKEALSRGQRLIYVTPKNSQHATAEDAVAQLRKNGTKVKSLTLNAKARMCLKEEVICNPSYCQYAKDYYDKVDREKLLEKTAKLARKVNLSEELFKKLGEKYEVCPFELSLDSIENADLVIGDYNYVFSPRNTLGRFTHSLSKDYQKPNLVIDEAHNLPGRACDYFSKGLSSAHIVESVSDLSSLNVTEQIKLRSLLSETLFAISSVGKVAGKKEAKVTISPQLFDKIRAELTALMLERMKGKGNTSATPVQSLELSKSLKVSASKVSASADSSLSRNSGQPAASLRKIQDPIISLANYLSDFQEALSYEGEAYLHLYTKTRAFGNKDFGESYDESLKVVCCDASDRLRLAHKEFAHVVAFSATIKPFEYFGKLCGFDEGYSCREYFSPFPRENRKILVIPQVSTKYSDRERNYEKIAEAILRLTSRKVGNYFVFFPSFAFLEEVYKRSIRLYEGRRQEFAPSSAEFRFLKQESEISKARAKEMIESLNQGLPTIVFAVQGGVFAEGVDYPGDMLIGALIVGPGLPNFNFEREQIRSYYEKQYGQGFDYAYVYPAMAKVIQAAGRVIRSGTDRGLIVLMDKRFTEGTYLAAMPSDWHGGSVNNLVSNSLVKDIDCFWSSFEQKA